MSKLESEDDQRPRRERLLKLQKRFAIAIEEVVEQETETWIAEFRTSLAELSRTYSTKDQGKENLMHTQNKTQHNEEATNNR